MENKKTTIGSGRSPLGFWWISALIVLAIFGIEYFYSSDSAPKEISQKEFFSEVLPSGSVKEVVIFNKDYAKVFLTPEALKSDKYKDLVKGFGTDRAKGTHMKVIFVSADNFEKTFNEVIENSNLDV